MVEERDMTTSVNCLQMCPNNVLVVGLGNGFFSGWNLNTNQLDSMQVHQSAISALTLKGSFLISGDSNGEIVVKDASSFADLLRTPPAQGNRQDCKSPVVSLALLQQGLAQPIVVGGHLNGIVTLLSVVNDPQTG